MEETEITIEHDEDINLDGETDYGPFAVAAVALVGVGTAGVVIGRNYERVRDAVRTRLAVRREARELQEIESAQDDPSEEA